MRAPGRGGAAAGGVRVQRLRLSDQEILNREFVVYDALYAECKRRVIVALAGSTDTGAVDPLNAIAEAADAHKLWLHVDGAYGAMFALCALGKKALSGIELSDSLTLDPRKGLFMPCGSGAVLVGNGQHLHNAYRYDAPYMQDRPSLASLEEEGNLQSNAICPKSSS